MQTCGRASRIYAEVTIGNCLLGICGWKQGRQEYDASMLPRNPRSLATAAVCVFAICGALRAQGDSLPPAALNAAQIVEQMQRHNQARNEELKHYQSVRHYTVEYKGIATIDAGMEVEVRYDAASGKT